MWRVCERYSGGTNMHIVMCWMMRTWSDFRFPGAKYEGHFLPFEFCVHMGRLCCDFYLETLWRAHQRSPGLTSAATSTATGAASCEQIVQDLVSTNGFWWKSPGDILWVQVQRLRFQKVWESPSIGKVGLLTSTAGRLIGFSVAKWTQCRSFGCINVTASRMDSPAGGWRYWYPSLECWQLLLDRVCCKVAQRFLPKCVRFDGFGLSNIGVQRNIPELNRSEIWWMCDNVC